MRSTVPPSPRLTGGIHRGRKLIVPPGDAIRPTTGKVREALFNILGPAVVDGDWLDLFAGSGAVGLEAYSRGARRVVMVEQAPPALAALRANVAAIAKTGGVEVLAANANSVPGRLAGQAFDTVSLDPPYALDVNDLVVAIFAAGLVRPTGKLVIEHAANAESPVGRGFATHDRRRYGATALSFLVADP